ncbi:hypothetical protein [Streptomyces sp. MMS24-I29]|uniref:hypothetical protein n=1 Tax=Streptomyces sp. MMS24-I29 TaxID=3351480 RepID=UPI003C7B58FF
MSIMTTLPRAAAVSVGAAGNCPICKGTFESCRCRGGLHPSTPAAPRAGVIGDGIRREDDASGHDGRGYERDETDTNFRQLVRRLAADGDRRAVRAGRRARRTLAEMDPGHTRQPILRMTTTDIVYKASRACTSCGGQGGRMEDTSGDGVSRQTWMTCHACGGTGVQQ